MNDFYEIFLNLLPPSYKIYRTNNKPFIFLYDIDQDGIYEVIGIYDDHYELHIRILKYVQNKWCVHLDKELNEPLLLVIRMKTLDKDHASLMLEFKVNDQKNKIIMYDYKDHALEEIVYHTQSENIRQQINLYPAYINAIGGKKYGYIDNSGKFIISPNFDETFEFQINELAIVRNELYGIINDLGEFVIKPKYDFIGDFHDELAVIIDDQGFKVIDESGHVITHKAYGYINSYQEKRALFYHSINDQLLYGYLDQNGNEVIQAIYQNGTDFNKGNAVVKLSDKQYFLIDLSGRIIQSYHYDYVGQLGDGYLAFKTSNDGLFGYLDTTGKVMISPIYQDAQSFKNGKAIVGIKGDLYGLIDKKGNYIIKPVYNIINDLGENRYALGVYINPEKPYLGYHYALGTGDGKVLSNVIFKQMNLYNKGITSVTDQSNTYFLDLSGNRVKSLPIISGQGELELIDNLIKVDQDYVIYYLDRYRNIVYQPNEIIPIKPSINVMINKYKPNTDYLVYYPFITSLSETMNHMLKEKSLVIDIDPDETLDFSYYGNFVVSFYEKNLLSIRFEGYRYPFGAAHGMPYRTYCHIDLEKSECYSLEDLFKEDVNYVKELSEIIDKKIKSDKEYDYLFPDAYHGISNDQPFYVDEEAIYLYFEPYEIAPYAAGFPTFSIKFSEISDLINYNGDFWNAFN